MGQNTENISWEILYPDTGVFHICEFLSKSTSKATSDIAKKV